ncbi:ABC transporter permease [Acidianus brierleyi]|uniref:ABC transporter permease n=1 Tax=Acidianus brierleyi TaxID=41673 RepID=A0A2U9IC50_9CREN|nr:ABC transporter permease [Acidianus brierleyi]AWR93601.1 ABC transporter permease [Acidianus brierleyi]
MLREILYIVVMQIKGAKSYALGYVFFSLLFPLGFMLVFASFVSNSYRLYIISGTLTAYLFISTFTAVANNLANEIESGRFSLILDAGVRKELYSISIALSQIILDIMPILTILTIGVLIYNIQLKSIPLIIIALSSSIALSSIFGMTLASVIKNPYEVSQYSNVLGFALTFFAPVYYPLSFIPLPYRYLVFLEPSTYVSQSIYYSLEGNAYSLLWSLGAVMISFLLTIINKRSQRLYRRNLIIKDESSVHL